MGAGHRSVGTKKKAGPNERTGFLKKLESSCYPNDPPLDYLLLPTVAGAGACLLAQAPRVRVAAARATTAAILVMVMVNFASFLCWLLEGLFKPNGRSDKEKSFFSAAGIFEASSGNDFHGCPNGNLFVDFDNVLVGKSHATMARRGADQ